MKKKVRRRYIKTGLLIFAVLVVAVLAGRAIQGDAQGGKLDNPKTKGPVDAPVHIVVYSDFQCPACNYAREPIEKVFAEFPDQILLEFRHYPLERNHKWAMTAALFAECAAEQGAFWAFHDLAYEHQKSWSAPEVENAAYSFVEYADQIGLDRESLTACIEREATEKKVRKELESGQALNVRSTPTILVNGERLVGGKQFEERASEIIKEAISKAARTK